MFNVYSSTDLFYLSMLEDGEQQTMPKKTMVSDNFAHNFMV